MRVIDAHGHLLTPTVIDVLERRHDCPRIRRVDGSLVVEFTPGHAYPLAAHAWNEEAKLEHMASAGIDFAVVSNVGGISVLDLVDAKDAPSIARAANEELADLSRRHPERFAGLATLPVRAGDRAVEELHHAVSLGLRGAFLYSNAGGRLVSAREFRPVFEAAAGLDVPIQLHPTRPLSAPWLETDVEITAIGFLFDTSAAALALVVDGVFEEFPSLKLQLCHVGSLLAYTLGRIDYQAELFPADVRSLSEPPSAYIRRMYTDTVCVWPPALAFAVDVFGPERITFATDEPWWACARSVETFEAVALSDTDRETIASGTAVQLFGLDTT
jgi:aminocarboxymuconate-semialdehyde decarboxylase